MSQVKGSGPNGRILYQDVVSFTPTAAKETRAEAPAEKKAAPTPAAGQVAHGGNQYQDIPLTSVREIIAKRLLESKTTIPHYYLKIEIVTADISG